MPESGGAAAARTPERGEMKLLRNGEVVSGAVLAALGIYVILEARQWEYLGPEGPGPGFFPIWYGIALVVLSVALIAINVRRGSAQAAEAAAGSRKGRALAAWLGLVACVALLKPLGFIVSFALFSLFLVRFLYGESLARSVAVAAGGALGFYLVFDVALNVSLPTGVLGF
jgi:putative tricarboxylic transport membrane protein